MNRIDELFKNKLANHPVAPPADAWQKVEAGLTKKNSAWVWRLAAAFVLFGLLSGTWYLWNNNTEAQPGLAEQPGSPQKENTIPVQPETQKQDLVAESSTPSKQKTKTTTTGSRKAESQKVNIMTEEPAEMLIETDVLVAENKIPEAAPARKPIVIEFTLDAMPVKITEPAFADAGTEEEKSGLKKILEKARDLKNGDGELGSLRDAKNELFAFDFRKDKPKRN
ncbi:MAG: hypothetical protein KIT62_15855 [Cyclobacteriaceae bacterium]|nr:hypothetical protein [Cyclobacteriaceae bacterium]